MRLTKTVDGVKYTFLYKDGLLVQETRGSKVFDYSYDANGNLTMLKYRSSPTGSVSHYYYALNSRGDVIGIYSATGSLMAKYTYDVWGNVLSVTNSSGEAVSDSNIAKLQPFRYRSYYFDTESNFYYLQSRYYDPVTHRFINADACYDTGTGVLGYNTYVYCLNNPIQRIDWDGECSKFLGFLWKIDCKQTTCKTSKNYIEPKLIGPTYQYNNGQGQVYFYNNENDATNAYENAKDNEVIIYDARTNDDPNMRVYGSYRITSRSEQNEICEIMIAYNRSYPVSPAWDRTVDSMISEWNFHNAAYYFHYKRERTRDCDFNNGDEDKGLWDYARR